MMQIQEQYMDELIKELAPRLESIYSDDRDLPKYFNEVLNMYTQIAAEATKNNEPNLNIVDLLMSENFIENQRGLELLHDLCMVYNMNLISTLNFMILGNVSITRAILEFSKLKGNPTILSDDEYAHILDDEYISFIQQTTLKNFEKVVRNKDIQMTIFKKIPQSIKRKMLKTTFQIAEEEIKNGTTSTLKIDLSKHMKDMTNSVLDDLMQNYNNILGVIDNKKSYAKLFTENNRHFLHNLTYSGFEYSEKHNSFYFADLKDGLALGYTTKAFLLGIDKAKAIRELRHKIQVLESYHTNESKSLINYTESLIELIEQQKYADQIPFKAIGKALNMTKNEAKNYAKKVLHSVNNDVFYRLYDRDMKEN